MGRVYLDALAWLVEGVGPSSSRLQARRIVVGEGRDQQSGDSFIRTGSASARGEDIYVTRDSGPACEAYLDLVAAARTYLPALVAELRALREEVARLGGRADVATSSPEGTNPLAPTIVGD